MPRGRYCQPTEGQVPPRARARRAVEVAVHTHRRAAAHQWQAKHVLVTHAKHGKGHWVGQSRTWPHFTSRCSSSRSRFAGSPPELRDARPPPPASSGAFGPRDQRLPRAVAARVPAACRRSGRRTARGAAESAATLCLPAKAKGKQRCKVPGRGNTSGQAARVIQAGYRPGARARMPPGAPKANPSPYEPLASAPRRGTLLGGCREQPVVQGRRVRLYGRVARPAPVPHVRWTRPDAKQARRGA